MCQENISVWITLLTQATAAGLIFAVAAKFTVLTFAQVCGKPHELSADSRSPVKYPGNKISTVRILDYLGLFIYEYL